MDTKQLSAWFAANKVEVLGVGAASVAGLALLQRKRSGGTGSGVTAGAVAPGTIPAAAVVPTGSTGGTYDSSSFDAYNALQDEIGTLARQNEAAAQTGAGGSGVGAAVSGPLASSLFAPTGSGTYVRTTDGTIGEVESDGSVFGMTPQQWGPLAAQGAAWTSQVGNVPYASTAANLAKKNPTASVG